MQTEVDFVNVREVLSRILRHPMLQNVDLEQAVSYTVDFIGIFGYSKMYEEKRAYVEIKNHRALLPCDLISIIMIKNCATQTAMRYSTDVFFIDSEAPKNKAAVTEEIKDAFDKNLCNCNFVEPQEFDQNTYKTQGRVIYTSFKEGTIEIEYKSIPVDEEGFPLLINNPVYLKCLEAYIKKEAFTVLFDMMLIKGDILQNAQQQYAWLAGQLQSEMRIPSVSEMESISNIFTTLVQGQREFDNGFKNLGVKELVKNH